MRKIIHLTFLVLIFLALAISPSGALDDDVQIALRPVAGLAGSYPWISFLSLGPYEWLEKPQTPEIHGRAYRIVVTTSEIYDKVYVEEITVGDEGCCQRVRKTRQFDLNAFAKKYRFFGEQSGFKFLRWTGAKSFEFKYQGHTFTMSHIDKDNVTINQRS
jgi:hypothetical protein